MSKPNSVLAVRVMCLGAGAGGGTGAGALTSSTGAGFSQGVSFDQLEVV